MLTIRSFPSPNFTKGRKSDFPIDTIVIHVTEGSAASVRSWFGSTESQVSAHYMVDKQGGIDQFVREEDTAWHAGRVSNPTARVVRARVGMNPNTYSIGIEHEGDGKHPLTEAQEKSSAALIRDIISRHPAIRPDPDHIIPHRSVYDKKTCPGAIDVDALILAAALKGTARPGRPITVWSDSLNDWLVVTRYVNDEEWFYVRSSVIARMTPNRATTPLSKMPQYDV